MPRTSTLAVALLLALQAGVAAHAHPKPGAHADVRFTVDDHAVTGEFLMNLRFAEQLVRWPREARDEVADGEVAAGRAAFEEYLGGPIAPGGPLALDRRNRVVVDGVEVSPILAEFRVVRPAPESRPGFVDVTQAQLPQVLVRVEYPLKARPRAVSLAWGAYPRDYLAQGRDLAPISDIEGILTAFGEVLPVRFAEREPEFTWHAPAVAPEDRFRALPPVPRTPASSRRAAFTALPLLAAVGLAGLGVRTRSRGAFAGASAAVLATAAAWSFAGPASTPLPGREEAARIFEDLHANIYRAFDYTRETDIYDALARSVDGPLLPSVYDGIYRSLIMQEEGGALARVRRVEPVETRAETIESDPASGRAALGITARWRVEGVVYHWGHSHARLIEHAARFRVESRAEGWRLVSVEPLEQRRLDPAEAGRPVAGAP